MSAITHPPKHSTQRAIDHFIGSQVLHRRRPIRAHGNQGDEGKCQRSPRGSSRSSSTAISKAACVTREEIVDITADQAVAATAPSILANGLVPRKIIEERATACGFSKDQSGSRQKEDGRHGLQRDQNTARGSGSGACPNTSPGSKRRSFQKPRS